MTDHADRPLLFLDVDGTLLPYGGARLPSTHGEWDDWQDMSNPQLAKLVPEHGPRLLALPCDLIWATAWMQDANEVIAPLLGLPQLPVADLPEAPEEDDADVLHWKTRALVDVAAGRPFVWVDDEITGLDRAWVSTHHRGPALLHRVDSNSGLTDTDFAELDDWLREVVGTNEQRASAVDHEDVTAGRSASLSTGPDGDFLTDCLKTSETTRPRPVSPT